MMINGRLEISVTFNDEVEDLVRDRWMWDLTGTSQGPDIRTPSPFDLAA
jgi:hypothetical protein